PWPFGGNDNSLVATFLKPGLHNFYVRAITSDGQVANDNDTARVIAAPKPPAKLAGAWTRNATTGRWTTMIGSIGWETGPNQSRRSLPLHRQRRCRAGGR